MTRRDPAKSRRRGPRSARALLAPMTLAAALAVSAGRADAGSTCYVLNTGDGNTFGTLRSAIAEANADPGSTIAFSSFLAGETITLGSALPPITAATIIDGSGAPGVTINGGGNQVFNAAASGGTVVVENLSVTNSGGNTVSSGALQGSLSAIVGNVADSGSLVLGQLTAGTYAGAISGTGSVTIGSVGTITFSGANTYTGGTLVTNFSTLQGTTTSLQGAIADSGTVAFNQATTGTYAGVISGTGSVYVTGSGGGVTFTGSNTYAGGTTVNGEDLLISSDANLGGPKSGLTLAGLGNLDATATLTSARTISVPDLGQLNAAAGVTATFSGVISGAGELGINGTFTAITDTGTVVLSGQNTYSGGTYLGGGILSISSSANLGTGALDFYNNGGTLAITKSLTLSQGVVLGANATIAPSSGTTATLSGAIVGYGSLTIAGAGTVDLTGANTYSGGTTVNAGATLAGTTSGLQGTIFDYATVAFNQSAAGTFNGTISGTGNVTVAGGGTVTFANANSYTGGTTVLAGGSLAGTSATLLGPIVDNGTLTLNVTGSATTGTGSEPFGLNVTGSGTLAKGGSGTLTINGSTTFGGTISVASGSLDVANGSSLEGDGGINVAGRLQLNGPSAVVSGGTLTVASGGTLTGTGTITNNVQVNAGGTINVLATNDLILAGISNTNAGTNSLGGITTNGAATLEVSRSLVNTGTTSGSGNIYTAESTPGVVGLTNNGTMDFSGAATNIHGLVFNGPSGTITNGGTGVLTFFGGLTNQGSVDTVAGSRTVIYGTESGGGAFAGAGVVEIDGKIAIDPAQVSFGGDLVLKSTTDYVMEIGGTTIGSQYDSLAVSGMATLSGTLDVDLIGGFVPTLGESFTAISYSSYTGMFDRINGLDLGDGLELEADYTSSGLVLTVVPGAVTEPASVVLVALGLAGAVVAARGRAAR